jgi:hypothetical protein
VAYSCLRHQEIIFRWNRFTKSARLSLFHYIRADARTAASLGRSFLLVPSAQSARMEP